MSEAEDPVRREIAETRNQLIKATNQVGLLVVETKELRRLADRHERRLGRNSTAAYLLFVALLGTAFWVAYRTRTARLEADRASLERVQKDAERALAQAQGEARLRVEADGKAMELYELLRSGRDKEALDRYPNVAKLPLAKLEAEVLREGIGRVRGQAAHAAYEQGVASFEAGQWRRTVQDLRKSLQIASEMPWAASLRYQLGLALLRLGQNKEAAVELEQALQLGGDEVGPDAAFFLATAYDELRQRAHAIAEYRRFATRFPEHRLGPAARRRIAELSVR